MFQTLDQFSDIWNAESASTQSLMINLTDDSLAQEVLPGHWTLGRIAWHIVTAIGVIASRTGLSVDIPDQDFPVPASSAFISASYQQASNAIVQAIKLQWNNKSLYEVHTIFGQTMSKGDLLTFLVAHQIHHRGQMTILMRQAGLTVPGLYGPAKEEWANMGMEAPKM
ncbi:hypothetical protein WQ54_06600 [Bacillus sp. SA1-12]|uniref:DinB family protein n=1 Tax=Bacillus sp. SA1-12 TaxID=1455638 RepID=UPI0006256895|nr:DinB family protein [Bacillus sp. SA1-12]KKI92853.1 hypothetical protein WQ54_06600 [Bacillus sp. SA1-12]